MTLYTKFFILTNVCLLLYIVMLMYLYIFYIQYYVHAAPAVYTLAHALVAHLKEINPAYIE